MIGEHPPLKLRSQPGDPIAFDGRFTEAFRLGRDPECDVSIVSPQVSRIHAEVLPYKGHWWARDLGSTNGLLVDGELTDQALLKDGSVLQLGRGGPILRVGLEGASPPSTGTGSGYAAAPAQDPNAARPTFRSEVPDTDPATQEPSPGPRPLPGVPEGAGEDPAPSGQEPVSPRPTPEVPAVSEGPEETEPGAGSLPGGPSSRGPLSLEEVQEKYLNPKSAQPAGEHTRMIRVAFDKVRKKQRRRSTVVLGAVLVLLAGAVAYGAYQRHRVSVLDRRAADVFRTMKSYEVQLVQLRQLAEESGSQALEDQLTRIDSLRRDVMADYQGYVQDRGLYRKLGSVEERLIFHTARLFGESEFAVSGSFVEAVQEEIHGYWLSPGGRERYREALTRARENGYTGRIVETMRGQGVPPEFFYLALQESDFKADAVGPETRWGRAKGMWQFIPTTARRYGLDPGPLQDTGSRDPGDDRQDFELASAAAARYLRDLHGVLTQASGLLVMAAYNWGEHRVAPRLEDLPTPRDVFQAEFSEVPTNPEARNYWAFLNEHGDRMPEETKDYVLKIFSAAVIGQDPEHFGFDFENPLAPYLE